MTGPRKLIYPFGATGNLGVLKGKYVTLRPLTVEDAELTQSWRMSGRAFLLNKGAQTVEEQAAWIASRPFDPKREMNFVMVLSPQPSVYATGAIVPEELRRVPQPVGMISLVDIDLVHGRAEPGHLLIGEPEAVKGIPVVFEACKLLYELAFDTLGLHRLYGPIASGNGDMLTYHKYLGFTVEGRQRDHYLLNGKRHDAVMIGMLEDEYRTIALPKLNRMIGVEK